MKFLSIIILLVAMSMNMFSQTITTTVIFPQKLKVCHQDIITLKVQLNRADIPSIQEVEFVCTDMHIYHKTEWTKTDKGWEITLQVQTIEEENETGIYAIAIKRVIDMTKKEYKINHYVYGLINDKKNTEWVHKMSKKPLDIKQLEMSNKNN